MPKPTRTDARALRHPLWVAALVLLLVNDHLLKGAGVLDGAWTGKLSDLAGMLVAPVLVSALFQWRAPASRHVARRAWAFVVVGGWFAAANLVPEVGAITARAGSWVGLDWHFIADPTDLVALGMLPLTWHVAAHRGPVFSRRTAQDWTERLALGLGVASCVASPTPDPSWRTSAYLINDTGAPVEVRLRWVEVAMDCAEVAQRPAEILARASFEPGIRFQVGINETLPITRERVDDFGGPVFPGEDAGPSPAAGTQDRLSGPCDAVILSIDGLDDERLVFWGDLPEQAVPIEVPEATERRRLTNALTLLRQDEDNPDVLALLGPAYTIEVPDDRYEGGAACTDYGSITGFDWSGLPWVNAGNVSVRLTEVRPTLDGCVALSFVGPDNDQGTGFICVPPDDFPFQRNAQVLVDQTLDTLRIRQENLVGEETWRVGELFIARGVGTLSEGPFNLQLMAADEDCEGLRMECGGFRVPTPGTVTMGDGTRFVHPGDTLERTDRSGRLARLRVGRAETIYTTRPACGAGRDQLGARLEALVVYGEEPR